MSLMPCSIKRHCTFFSANSWKEWAVWMSYSTDEESLLLCKANTASIPLLFFHLPKWMALWFATGFSLLCSSRWNTSVFPKKPFVRWRLLEDALDVSLLEDAPSKSPMQVLSATLELACHQVPIRWKFHCFLQLKFNTPPSKRPVWKFSAECMGLTRRGGGLEKKDSCGFISKAGKHRIKVWLAVHSQRRVQAGILMCGSPWSRPTLLAPGWGQRPSKQQSNHQQNGAIRYGGGVLPKNTTCPLNVEDYLWHQHSGERGWPVDTHLGHCLSEI